MNYVWARRTQNLDVINAKTDIEGCDAKKLTYVT